MGQTQHDDVERVNGARIVQGNVSADNGLIHVIDKVLVPRFMIL